MTVDCYIFTVFIVPTKLKLLSYGIFGGKLFTPFCITLGSRYRYSTDNETPLERITNHPRYRYVLCIQCI